MSITFRVFEPVEGHPETRQSYQLRRPTNARIDTICELLFSQKDAELEKRLFYLKHHSNPPISKAEEGQNIDLPELYTSSDVFSFLAQELFLGFPKVAEISGGEVQKNKPLFSAIDRAEVYRALDFFFSSFGMMLYESQALKSVFALAQQLHPEAGEMLTTKSNSTTGETG